MPTLIHSIELMSKAAKVCYMDLRNYKNRFFMKVKSFYFLFILLHNKSRNLKELGILRTSLFEKRSIQLRGQRERKRGQEREREGKFLPCLSSDWGP